MCEHKDHPHYYRCPEKGPSRHPVYKAAYMRALRAGSSPTESREVAQDALARHEAQHLDSLIDEAAARAAEEHAADDALLARVPEDLRPLARLLLGGDHRTRWGFEADPINLAGPEDLDRLASALPGVVRSPRPARQAGVIDGITVGAAVSPEPLDDDVASLLPTADLARRRQQQRFESQQMWSAINAVRIRWATPWTDQNREARRAYARRLVGWFMALFDSLFGSPDNTSASTQ